MAATSRLCNGSRMPGTLGAGGTRCANAPSRARGCVMTRMRETSLTVDRKRALPRTRRLVAERLLQHVDRAGGERLVGLEDLAAVDRRGDDQDRRRKMRHDVFGGGKAAHDRQHHVHRHDIRPQLLAELDPLLAVDGNADEIDLRVGLQNLPEPAADGGGIFHNEDADLLHAYIANCLMRAEKLRLIEFALDHVALSADLLAALDVFRRGERGDEDRGNVAQTGIGADALDEREAVHPRHFDVNQEERVFLLRRHFERLLGGSRQIHLIARRFKDALLQHPGGQRNRQSPAPVEPASPRRWRRRPRGGRR